MTEPYKNTNRLNSNQVSSDTWDDSVIRLLGRDSSGKTHLARHLGQLLSTEVIHFDQHFWEAGGFNKKRPVDLVQQEIKSLASGSQWIMEGVFGELAAFALPKATALIFLNKSRDECKAALLARGSQSYKQHDPVLAEKNFSELLAWSQSYWDRENSKSLMGHLKLFDDFPSWKLQLRTREESDDFLSSLS